ncbi:uncharacterized protein FIBRA_05975 [Fibroporia radiculosa]|uniref:RNA 3'-terminal phosphate cyclase n=1 Tax=Fibroporia radiculosa TaxID=599839 RepID=J4IB06_9APHY|nr:uncharacterized protein FIBRA_05975 [Fibroporia radiculosa]CCM03826.1 predicted protein [Fibroporia radiculosa]
MAAVEPLLVDGSVLEGGGQILRNTVAFAVLLSRPVSIHNIRHNRRKPGLKAQHAAGLRLVAKICSGHLSGCDIGSSAIEFRPGPIGLFAVLDIYVRSTLGDRLTYPTDFARWNECTPGTTNRHAARVFLPFIQRRFGLTPDLRILKRGFVPKGGGEVIVSVTPQCDPLPSVVVTDRGSVTSIGGRAYVAGLPAHLATSMRDGAATILSRAGMDPGLVNITAVREKPEEAIGSGSGIVLWAETSGGCVLGGSAIGAKGKDPEKVGAEAAEELIRNLGHGGCVDEYLQDQMIIFLALAKGRSLIKAGPLTLHTKSAIWVAEQLTGAKFLITELEGQTWIECNGIGYTALV